MLTPSLDPQGRYYTQWKLGNPYQKFNDKDLRKKPYRYLGSRKYEGMVPRRATRPTPTTLPSSAWGRRSIAAR